MSEPAKFEWKQVSMTTTVPREVAEKVHRIPVREPWLRRALIRLGFKRLQRYREVTFSAWLAKQQAQALNNLMYGDGGAVPREFDGLMSAIRTGAAVRNNNDQIRKLKRDKA